jgi:hypothetical protein
MTKGNYILTEIKQDVIKHFDLFVRLTMDGRQQQLQINFVMK